MFQRYVAIGDSSTEGMDDPDGNGGYRGWANRLAEHLARVQGSVLYANLGVRGKRTRHILEEQLEPALALRPDLTTVFSGTNDVVARRFDAGPVGRQMLEMQQALIAGGATVLTFTLPDLAPVMPVAKLIRSRVLALNEALRHAARESGAILVDMARYPVATDPRLWSGDRFHANSLGHERIAAALAWALKLPETDDSWSQPLPGSPPRGRFSWLTAELAWGSDHLLPWIWRHLRGRSSGDGIRPKRPQLLPLAAPLSGDVIAHQPQR